MIRLIGHPYHAGQGSLGPVEMEPALRQIHALTTALNLPAIISCGAAGGAR